jgi:hypothetical protein
MSRMVGGKMRSAVALCFVIAKSVLRRLLVLHLLVCRGLERALCTLFALINLSSLGEVWHPRLGVRPIAPRQKMGPTTYLQIF